MSDVGKSDPNVALDWAEQLADADALEQRAGELERLARQIRTTALRARVRVRRAKLEESAKCMLEDIGVPRSEYHVGKFGYVHDVGELDLPNDGVGQGRFYGHALSNRSTIPNDGPEGNVGGREVSRPMSAPAVFTYDVGNRLPLDRKV